MLKYTIYILYKHIKLVPKQYNSNLYLLLTNSEPHSRFGGGKLNNIIFKYVQKSESTLVHNLS